MEESQPVTTDTEQAQNARRAARLNFFLSTSITSATAANFVARVRNLSAGGMMVEGNHALDRDEEIVAELRGIGPIRGRVAWIQGQKIGIAFNREIDPDLARKPLVTGASTPDYAKPIIINDRKLTPAALIAPVGRLD